MISANAFEKIDKKYFLIGLHGWGYWRYKNAIFWLLTTLIIYYISCILVEFSAVNRMKIFSVIVKYLTFFLLPFYSYSVISYTYFYYLKERKYKVKKSVLIRRVLGVLVLALIVFLVFLHPKNPSATFIFYLLVPLLNVLIISFLSDISVLGSLNWPIKGSLILPLYGVFYILINQIYLVVIECRYKEAFRTKDSLILAILLIILFLYTFSFFISYLSQKKIIKRKRLLPPVRKLSIKALRIPAYQLFEMLRINWELIVITFVVLLIVIWGVLKLESYKEKSQTALSEASKYIVISTSSNTQIIPVSNFDKGPKENIFFEKFSKYFPLVNLILAIPFPILLTLFFLQFSLNLEEPPIEQPPEGNPKIREVFWAHVARCGYALMYGIFREHPHAIMIGALINISVLFFTSFNFSVTRMVEAIVILNILLGAILLWVGPIIYGLTHIKTTYSKAYEGRLVDLMHEINDHVLVIGFGDLGRRLISSLIRREIIFYKDDFDRLVYTYSILLPNGKLGILLKKFVAIDKREEHFEFTIGEPGLPKLGMIKSPLKTPFEHEELGIDYYIPAVLGEADIDNVRKFAGLERARLVVVTVRDVHLSFKAFDIFKEVPIPTILAVRSSHAIPYFAWRTGTEGIGTVFLVFPQLLSSMMMAREMFLACEKYKEINNKYPKVLVMGKGPQLFYLFDSYLLNFSSDEERIFDNIERIKIGESVYELYPKFYLLSDDHENIKENSVEIPETEIKKHFKNLVGFKIYVYLVSRYVSKSPLYQDQREMRKWAITVINGKSRDYETVLKVISLVKPDIIVLSDFNIDDELRGLENIYMAVSRLSQKTEWPHINTPPLLLIEGETGEEGRARNIGDVITLYSLSFQNSHYNKDLSLTYPCQFGFRRKEKGSDVLIGDAIIDVLEDPIDRICGIIKSCIDPEKYESRNNMFEIHLCLQDVPGALAKIASAFGGIVPEKVKVENDINLLPNFKHCRISAQPKKNDKGSCFCLVTTAELKSTYEVEKESPIRSMLIVPGKPPYPTFQDFAMQYKEINNFEVIDEFIKRIRGGDLSSVSENNTALIEMEYYFEKLVGKLCKFDFHKNIDEKKLSELHDLIYNNKEISFRTLGELLNHYGVFKEKLKEKELGRATEELFRFLVVYMKCERIRNILKITKLIDNDNSDKWYKSCPEVEWCPVSAGERHLRTGSEGLFKEYLESIKSLKIDSNCQKWAYNAFKAFAKHHYPRNNIYVSKKTLPYVPQKNKGLARIIVCNSEGNPGALGVTLNTLILQGFQENSELKEIFNMEYVGDYSCHEDQFAIVSIYGYLEKKPIVDFKIQSFPIKQILIRPVTMWDNWIRYAELLIKFLNDNKLGGYQNWNINSCDRRRLIYIYREPLITGCKFENSLYCPIIQGSGIFYPEFN